MPSPDARGRAAKAETVLQPTDKLEIAGVEVKPGERSFIDVPITKLYHAPLSMPVTVARGRKAGPTMFISAALHGDELNGVEIIRRLLSLKTLRNIRGCLIAVPIVNVQAFLIQSRYLPDRRDLNRSFPGSDKGSLAARMANVFLNEIVGHSDYGIDLHTGAIHRPNLPQIRADLTHPETERMANAFGAPVVMNAPIRAGSLREFTSKNHIPVLLYESGEALRFDEVCIRAGVRGVLNVMRELEMLPAKKVRRIVEPVVAESSSWIRAPSSGILRSTVRLGARVMPDQVLGMISDPYGQAEVELKAGAAGIVIGKTNLPPVNEGDALFHIAHFEKSREVAQNVEAFMEATETMPSLSQELPLV